MDPFPYPWRILLWASLLLSILFLAENHSVVFSDRYYIENNDLLFQYLPDFVLLKEAVAKGNIPLWTDRVGSGFPIAAYGYNAYLHPLSLFAAILPVDAITSLKILLYLIVLIGGLSFTASLLLFGYTQPLLILLGTALYHFSFFFMYKGYSLTLSFVLAPLILALIYQTVITNRTSYAVWFGLALGISLLAFYAPFQIRFVMALFFLVLCWMVFPARGGFRPTLLARLILGALLALLIAYPQFKMTYDLTRISPIAKQSLDFYLEGSLKPAFWNLFNIYQTRAQYLDDPIRASLHGGWASSNLLPVTYLLSLFSLPARDKLHKSFWWLAALSLFLAMGKYNPLYVFLAKNDLVFNLRLSSRFLFLWNIAFPVLAVSGLRALATHSTQTLKRSLAIYLAGLLVSTFLVTRISCALHTSGVEFADYFDAALKMNGLLAWILGLFVGPPYDRRFVTTLIMEMPWMALCAWVFVLLFAYRWIAYRQLLYMVGGLILIHGLWVTIPSNIRSSNRLGDVLVQSDLLGATKVDGHALHRVPENIRASLNVLYGVKATDTYNSSLFLPRYADFLTYARQQAALSNYGPLRWLGVDCIVSEKRLDSTLGEVPLRGNTVIYRITERPTFIWSSSSDSFGSDLQPVYNFSMIDEGLSTVVKVRDLQPDQNLVIFRNYYPWFRIFLNGVEVQPTLYRETFYRFSKLPSGENIIEFRFSLFNFLVG